MVSLVRTFFKIVADLRCALSHTRFCFYGTIDTITALPSAATSAAQAAAPAPISPRLGRRPVNHVCQFCGHTGPTYVKEKLGTCAIIGIVVLVVCFWPLFWLPLVMESCKDKQHICTNCQREVSLLSSRGFLGEARLVVQPENCLLLRRLEVPSM